MWHLVLPCQPGRSPGVALAQGQYLDAGGLKTRLETARVVEDRHPARARPVRRGDDLVLAVAVKVIKSYVQSSGQTVAGLEFPDGNARIDGTEDPHDRLALARRNGQYFLPAVAVDVAAGDVDARGRSPAESRKVEAGFNERLLPGLDPGLSARPKSGDDLADPVAVDIADGHGNTAAKFAAEGEKAASHGFRLAVFIEHQDMGRGPRPGAGDDLDAAVAVDVAGGDVHALLHARIVHRESPGQRTVAAEHLDRRFLVEARADNDLGNAVMIQIVRGQGAGRSARQVLELAGQP